MSVADGCRVFPRPFRFAFTAVTLFALMMVVSRDADACVSGPGNGTEETGDCLDFDGRVDLGPRGNHVGLVVFTAIPAIIYDVKALDVGVSGMSRNWNVLGVVGGSVTIALTATYVAEFGFGDDGVAMTIGGALIGAPALIGGVVGLVRGRRNVPASKQNDAIVSCTGSRCGLATPTPRLRQWRGGAELSVPLVSGQW
jgi:hypothetical protein